MKKSALCLLLCLLLALPCLSVAEQSRQVNRSCRIYFANGTELASRLNDGRLLTEVNGAEAVEHTFYIDPNGQTVDAVCVQYGEHILPYVVQAQDAQGDWQQIGAYTGDYAQGYAAFPACSQRFRLVFARDGEKLPLSLRQRQRWIRDSAADQRVHPRRYSRHRGARMAAFLREGGSIADRGAPGRRAIVVWRRAAHLCR